MAKHNLSLTVSAFWKFDIQVMNQVPLLSMFATISFRSFFSFSSKWLSVYFDMSPSFLDLWLPEICWMLPNLFWLSSPIKMWGMLVMNTLCHTKSLTFERVFTRLEQWQKKLNSIFRYKLDLIMKWSQEMQCVFFSECCMGCFHSAKMCLPLPVHLSPLSAIYRALSVKSSALAFFRERLNQYHIFTSTLLILCSLDVNEQKHYFCYLIATRSWSWVWFPAGAGPFCVGFACSLRVHTGFLRVLWFPPPTRHVHRTISSQYPWPRYWLRIRSQSQGAALWLPTAPQGGVKCRDQISRYANLWLIKYLYL